MLAVPLYKAIEVDAFSATRTGNALTFEAGKLAGRQSDTDPLFAEKVAVRKFAIRDHLLRILR